MLKNLFNNLIYRYKIKIAPYLKWYLLAFVFIISIASFFIPADILSKDLKVYFLDIGQGDAALVRTPQRQNILIDGGPDNSVIYKLGKYLPFWERKIDLVILTHPHADHLIGLVEVLKRYRVEKIVFTGVSYYSDFYKELKKLREEKNIPFVLAFAGRELNFGEIKIEILSPEKNLWNKIFRGDEEDGGGLNDTSVVAQLSFGKNSFLFMGDAGAEVEKALLSKFEIRNPKSETNSNSDFQNPNDQKIEILNLKSLILKVGHHGSDTSSSYEFLQAVSPELAVISVGKNKYGLPAHRVLYRLRKLGIPFLRTDENGDIQVRCGEERCLVD